MRAARYPPLGCRSFGPYRSAIGWRGTAGDLCRDSNQKVTLLAMIETVPPPKATNLQATILQATWTHSPQVSAPFFPYTNQANSHYSSILAMLQTLMLQTVMLQTLSVCERERVSQVVTLGLPTQGVRCLRLYPSADSFSRFCFFYIFFPPPRFKSRPARFRSSMRSLRSKV